VTFTAVVKDSGTGAAQIPTGTVSFFDGATLLGYGTLSTANGVTKATFTTSSLPVGSNSMTAAYNGNAIFAHSTSAAIAETIKANPNRTSSVALTSSSNPSGTNSYTSTYGQAVTFTATVTDTGLISPAQNPSGSVTFKYQVPGSSTVLTLGTVNLTGTGSTTTASYSISTLVVGAYNVTATYNGNSIFAPGTNATITQNVNQAGSSTTLTSSTGGNPSYYGQSVTFTAAVLLSSGGPAPGSVQFVNQTTGAVLGTVPLNSKGIASVATTTMAVGNDTIVANFLQNVDAIASSASLTQSVLLDNTKLALGASTTQSNTPETLTAVVTAVSPGSGTPTGIVTFIIDNTNVYYGTLTNGKTSVTIPGGLTAGTHTIEIVYGGDSNFNTGILTETITITNGRGT
jgi:hypothetical protein